MAKTDPKIRFERELVPHFESAYSLARWLTGNDADAADAFQEAALRAFRFMDRANPENPRAWFFQIVRNSSYSWMKQRRNHIELKDAPEVADGNESAERLLVKNVALKELRAAIQQLPAEYKEVLVLRELEEMSYAEISQIASIPEGTVMSRLSRGRSQLRKILGGEGSSDER